MPSWIYAPGGVVPPNSYAWGRLPEIFNGVSGFNQLSDADRALHDVYVLDTTQCSGQSKKWYVINYSAPTNGVIACTYQSINPPLGEVIAARITEVDCLAITKRAFIVGNTSPAEMSSWSIKRNEALAYQTSISAADAPMLVVEAAARGITLTALVVKVLGKASALAPLEAAISGINGKHNDALTLLTTVEAVLAYDITQGWPV